MSNAQKFARQQSYLRMHRPSCHRANAYDVASALHKTLIGPVRACDPHVSLRPRPRRLNSTYAAPPNTTRARSGQEKHHARVRATELHAHRQREQAGSLSRLPAGDPVPSKHDHGPDLDAAAASPRLAYYEGLVGASSETEILNAKLQGGYQLKVSKLHRDTHGIDHVSDDGWTTHMSRLAETVRSLAAGVAEEELSARKGVPIKLDYQAFAVDPARSEATTPSPMPWMVPAIQRQELSAIQLLDEEISHFASFMSLGEDEVIARQRVTNHVRSVIRKVFLNRMTAYVFGSGQTRTALPMSDIDIGVYRTHGDFKPRDLEEDFEKLYNELRDRPEYVLVVHRGGAHPIITAQHKDSGIDVQIVASASKNNPQHKAMIDRLNTIPNLKDLYTLIRTAFGVRGFIDPYIGGISAYGTFMLLCAALTRRGTPDSVHASPATQLLHFLEFVADFDMTRYGLSLRDVTATRPFRKLGAQERGGLSTYELRARAIERNAHVRSAQYAIGQLNPKQPYLLCLQDRAKSMNDLGKRVHAIKHIQLTVRYLSLELRRLMKEYDEGKSRGDEGFSLLEPLMGRCHEVYAERRMRVQEYGQSLVARWAVEGKPKVLTREELTERNRRTRAEGKEKKRARREAEAEAEQRVRDEKRARQVAEAEQAFRDKKAQSRVGIDLGDSEKGASP